nr:MATE family efflux transporter [Tenacibaculum mesophilum]
MFLVVLIVFLSETIGLWFLNNKMTIPDSRVGAARIVFHISIVISIISVLQVPFNSILISRENMKVYAIIEIVNSVLKLLAAVVLLKVGSDDNLIFYILLLLVATCLTFLLYMFYTLVKYEEVNLRLCKKREYLLPLIKFSGWDLYGNASVMMRNHGINLMLNIYFGPILNAANAISIQIQSAFSLLSNNALTAIKPQVVKSYAKGNMDFMIDLIEKSIKYTSILLLLIIIPIYIEMPMILEFWLVKYPKYTVELSRLSLVFIFFANISSIVMSAIHATGKIKRSSLLNGTLYIMVLPISYFTFENFDTLPYLPYIYNIMFVVIGGGLNAYYLQLYIKRFTFKNYLLSILPPMIITFILGLIPIYLIRLISFENNLLRFFILVTVVVITYLFLMYLIILDKEDKQLLNKQVKMILFRNEK